MELINAPSAPALNVQLSISHKWLM